jgi:hypothetical protein
MANTHYLLLHGRGAELGDFKIFSDSHKKNIEKADKDAVVVQESTERAKRFREVLEAWPLTNKIKELHIWSHSIGAGLFLGYKDPSISTERSALIARTQAAGRKPTFDEVRTTEVGALFTDDLIASPYTDTKTTVTPKFAKGAIVKIWGCNAAIEGWVYSDTAPDGSLITDPADTSAVYYWRALNERNQPKPSIAQSLADFFGITVYGASSGANIQVMHEGAWTATDAYHKKFHKFPPGSLPHRLHPSKGDYNPYKPTPSP